MRKDHIHIPTPGDHYSPTTGSAIPTIIYELSRCHAQNGGTTQVLVARGTRHDYAVGECIEYDLFSGPTKYQKYIDVAAGRIGLPRYFGEKPYLSACAAIPTDFDGPIFIHNNPVAVRHFRRQRRQAAICLWANNALFNTYSNQEVEAVAEAADLLICCSKYIADDVTKRLTKNIHKVYVVHNGVDIDRFTPSSVVGHEKPPVVLFVGRLVPQKGAHLLLQAALKIRDTHDFRIRIVGSSNFDPDAPLSSYEHQLRGIVASMESRVEFVPFVNRTRVVEMYHESAIFCVPSDWDDPCPLTVLEGMACGLPTIASHRGGIPEEGQDAILYFAPPDVDRLAAHLALLIGEKAARQKWGQCARTRSEQISWQHQYNCLCDVLAAH